MKFNCKVWPIKKAHPAFPNEKFHWQPRLSITLSYKHSPPSRRFEAVVDSGSPVCLFHASICRPLGIRRLEDGIEDSLKGIVGGPNVPEVPIYFHPVKITVGTEQFGTMAGFSWGLAENLLGRRGFFENFKVTIDLSMYPPELEVVRIFRA